MKRLLSKLRRLGKRQLTALAGSSVLAATAVALAFSSRPALSIAPVSLLLLHLTLQVIVLQYRLLIGLRGIGRIRTNQAERGRTDDRSETRSSIGEPVALFERIEYLQKRILAAVETERVDAADRHQEVLASRNPI